MWLIALPVAQPGQQLAEQASVGAFLPREASLESWQPLPSDEDPDTLRFEAMLHCDAGSLCHRGVLAAVVTIAPSYPLEPASFALSFQRHPAIKNGEQDKDHRQHGVVNALRQMSVEVNSEYPLPDAADGGRLLMAQVNLLLNALGVHASVSNRKPQVP